MLFCDFWCAEHYMNKADFKDAGIPFIQIDREYILSGKGQLQTSIQAFLETMGRLPDMEAIDHTLGHCNAKNDS